MAVGRGCHRLWAELGWAGLAVSWILYVHQITHSHGSARAKIWPSAIPKPLNRSSPKFYLRDYVMDIYHPAKFHPDRIRGSVSAHARFRASNCLLGYLFAFWGPGGSSNHLQPRRPHGFWRKIPEKTRFRARMCLLGVAKPNLKLYTPFCPKTTILGPVFDGTFSLENAFNIGHVQSKLPLIVIVAP